jgi:type II secretory ATPase GspE/PulE/Tfp pilus assembly ATPase PilB-like protein
VRAGATATTFTAMPEKNLPTLSLVPREELASLVVSDGPVPFSWPTPPYAAYPTLVPWGHPEPCEIEGLNGKLMHALLTDFDPGLGMARVQVPPSKTLLPLRLSQFRKLVLTQPLLPSPQAERSANGKFLGFHPSIDYRVVLNDGPPLTGRTVGHVETDAGLFLFPPLDGSGAVTRLFCPRAAFQKVDFGKPLGEQLVADDTATPAQINAALNEQKSLRDQRIGDVLLKHKVISPEQMSAALEAQSRMPMVRVGEALMALGYVNQTQLDEALAEQRKEKTVPLGELLVRRGHVQRHELRTALARKMGYPVVDVEAFPVELDALKRVPIAAAKRLNVLPLQELPGRLVMAIEDPSRRDVIDELEFLAQCKIVPVLAMQEHLAPHIEAVYRKNGFEDALPLSFGETTAILSMDEGGSSKLLAELELTPGSDRDKSDDAPIEQSDNSLVRLINTMIYEAHSQGVSDIHIESQPGKEKVRIRFRRDGRLKPYLDLPHTYRSALIARIKIMCDLDISERRRPQDGKINFARFVPSCPIELRVATIPTANGLEDAVLRILASAKPIPLDALGMSAYNLAALKAAIARPYGMVLCVGPTGSGKTTTLHSALAHINQPERKIWTAEDPVEITQPGLRQVQVNPKIDWTFAKALRAFLRADPDVIMVGEIRDEETAHIAVESSLTGHLVLSTLHTNSAAETITRLLDMGMDPFNFADSLLAVLAQRLVRRLCPHCRTSGPATQERTDELLDDYLHVWGSHPQTPSRDEVLADWLKRYGVNGELQSFHSPGCDKCDHTGVRGRAGIHELLSVSKPIRHLIQTGSRAEVIQQQAMAEGLRTLRQDGLEKVLQGITSIEEVRATSNA